MLYVLVVITTVYGGSVVAMQEFTSKAACEEVANFIRANAQPWYAVRSYCTPK